MSLKNIDIIIKLWLRDRRFKNDFNNDQPINKQGFTLIELLVVIIIVGLLAAIALPSFLNQATKARFAEAKSYVVNMNRLQQAYHAEKGVFASNIVNLSLGVSTSSSSYDYEVVAGDTSGNLSPPQPELIITNVAKPKSINLPAFAGVEGVTGVSIGSAAVRSIYCSSNVAGVNPVPPGKLSADGLATLCPDNFSLQ
jgi:prepilin-type N-terminal cleavage/methylation domain-containing protein